MADKNELSPEDYNKMVFEDGGGLVVDLTNVEEQKYELIPKGIQNVTVESCEYQTSKSSGMPMLAITFEIADGDFAKRKLYFYASFSSKALSGTKTQLMRLAPDIFSGSFRPQEIADNGILLGRACRVKIGHEEYQGEPRAKIQNLMPPAAPGEGGGDGFFNG